MGLTATFRQQLLDLIVNKASYTPPTTQFYALHAGTHITTEAASGAPTLITQHQIPDGITVAIDPSGVNESAVISSSTGAGPYTHTLTGNLANTHAVDVEVEFAPDPDTGAGFAEPVDAGYARQEETLATLWAAASGSSPSKHETAAEIDFGTATAAYKSGITHVGEYSASSGGTLRRVFKLASKSTPGATDGITIPIGELDGEMGNSDDTYTE